MKPNPSELVNEALQALRQVKTAEALQALRASVFHKKNGTLAIPLKTLKDITDPAQRKIVGEELNQAKELLLQAFDQAAHQFAKQGYAVDLSLPAIQPNFGHYHPIHLVQTELVTVFRTMGFMVHEGNERETEDFCFEFLNIPATHPARDLQDTFYLDTKRPDHLKEVMRTHTSNMQVRLMRQFKPPLKMVVPGRVFRNEAIDASHEHTFYQMEGFVVGEAISIANLTYFLKTALSTLLQDTVNIRLRPGYFPYVEPGFEADCSCVACGGKGCSVCKQTGWVEMLGCGMIHPKVLAEAGYEPGKYTGFAFGIGLNRLAMMKYGIKNIRLFMQNDLRFLEQF